MRKSIAWVILITLLLAPLITLADELDTHDGFTFLSSYEDCLSQIKAAHGKNYTKGESINDPSPVLSQNIEFQETFQGYDSRTRLDFTPITKKLFKVTHVIGMRQAPTPVEFMRMSMYFQNALNQIYGRTKPWNMGGENVISQTWKNKTMTINLLLLQKMADTPDDTAILTYTNKSAEALKLKEQATLEKEINKGL